MHTLFTDFEISGENPWLSKGYAPIFKFGLKAGILFLIKITIIFGNLKPSWCLTDPFGIIFVIGIIIIRMSVSILETQQAV